MATQFSDLPPEIRIQIFELVLTSQRKRRVVEVYRKNNGQIISKTRPPALSHVNRESRYVTLKTYKPWLPQFKDTKAFKPWASLVGKLAPEKVSGLNHVFFDLELDTLLFCKRESAIYGLGRLEKYHLKAMALNINGYLHFQSVAHALREIKSLKSLFLFDDKMGYGTEFKISRISKCLHTIEQREMMRPMKRIPNYTAPKVFFKKVESNELPFQRTWTTYQFPTGYAEIVRRNPLPTLPEALMRDNPSETSATSRKRKPDLDDAPSEIVTKRPRNDFIYLRTNQGTEEQQRLKKEAKQVRLEKLKIRAQAYNKRDEEERVRMQKEGVPHSGRTSQERKSVTWHEAVQVNLLLEDQSTRRNEEESTGLLNEKPRVSDCSEDEILAEQSNPQKIQQAHSVTEKLCATEQDTTVMTTNINAQSSSIFGAVTNRLNIPETPTSKKRKGINEEQGKTATLVKPVKRMRMRIRIQASISSNELPSFHTQQKLDISQYFGEQLHPTETPEYDSLTKSVQFTPWQERSPLHQDSSLYPSISASTAQEQFPDVSLYTDYGTPARSYPGADSPTAVSSSDLAKVHPKFGAGENPGSLLSPPTTPPAPIAISESAQSPTSCPATASRHTHPLFGIGSTPGFSLGRMALEAPISTQPFGQTTDLNEEVVPNVLDTTASIVEIPETSTENAAVLLTIQDSEPSKSEELSLACILEEFMAQRTTSDGVEILVRWQDYPDEIDWTWESVETLREDVPEMLDAWLLRDSEKVESQVEIYIVDEILGKKKIRGVPHYLVSWKGYPAAKDRTWEPCRRLKIDVPHLVEMFEQRKK